MVNEDTTIALRERICTDRALTYYQSSINSLLKSLEYNDATKNYHTTITLDGDDLEVLKKFAAEPPSNMHTWNTVSAILNGMYKGEASTNYQSNFQYNVGLETVIAVVLVYALYRNRLNTKQLSLFLIGVTSVLIAHFAHVRERLSEEGKKLGICDVDKMTYAEYLKYKLWMNVNCEVDKRFLNYNIVFQTQIRETIAFFEHVVHLIGSNPLGIDLTKLIFNFFTFLIISKVILKLFYSRLKGDVEKNVINPTDNLIAKVNDNRTMT